MDEQYDSQDNVLNGKADSKNEPEQVEDEIGIGKNPEQTEKDKSISNIKLMEGIPTTKYISKIEDAPKKKWNFKIHISLILVSSILSSVIAVGLKWKTSFQV